MKHPENFTEVDSLGVDYLGFIFYPKSKRDASSIDPNSTQKLKAKKVGVFVNEDLPTISEKVDQFGLSAIQLHGDESVEFCKSVKAMNLEVFKVFSVGEDFDFEQLEPYKKHVDYFLFDTKGKERGGNGYTFDWSILESYDNEIPLILSGGINPENIESAKNIQGLNLYALDLNSGIEIEAGLKDIEQLQSALI